MRGRIRAGILDPRLAIVRQCAWPSKTWKKREDGEPTPCYRCLALRPDDKCHFIERGRR